MFLQLIKNANFMKLWSAQTLAQLEATIVDFTIAVVISEAVKSTHTFGESATALVFALQFLPALPASLMAGFIADIIDRRVLMLFSNVFRSAFLLLFVFAANPGAHLYIFVFIMAIFMHSYDVYEKSTIRNVTHPNEISLANGLFIFTMNATTLIGVIAAGFLNDSVGLRAILLSGAVLYAIAAYLIYKLPKNINNYRADHYKEDQNVIKDTRKSFKRVTDDLIESFKYMKKYPPVALSLILATVVQSVMLIIASISFRYGSDVLGINSAEVSIYLLIPVAVGLALGGTISPIVTKMFGYRSVVTKSWFIGAVLMAVLGSIRFISSNLHPSFTFEFITFEFIIIITGLFITLIQAPSLELIQIFADEKMRGRIFGVLVGATNTVSGILVALSGIFIELLRAGKTDTYGTSKFMLSFAIFLLIILFIYSLILKRKLGDKDYTEFKVEEPLNITSNQ